MIDSEEGLWEPLILAGQSVVQKNNLHLQLVSETGAVS